MVMPWEHEPEPEDEADYDGERAECRRCARMLGMSYADLYRYLVPPDEFRHLPAWVVHQHRVVPLMRGAEVLFCAIADVCDRDALHVVSECAGVPLRFVLATKRDIEHTLWLHFKPREPR